LFIFGGYQDAFLDEINMINLKNLDFYKSYNEKGMLQLTRPTKKNEITFILKKNEKIKLNKTFFYKNILLENEKPISNIQNESNTKLINNYNKENQCDLNKDCINILNSNRNKNYSGDNIIDFSEKYNFSVKSLLLFYEISFLGKLNTYFNIKDLEDLIEISKFFHQNSIMKKLIKVLKVIKEIYCEEEISTNIIREIFNINFCDLKGKRNYFSTNFYHLKNNDSSEREFIRIYSKVILKFIDSSATNLEFFNIVDEKIFRFILNYIYNNFLPTINNNEINIYLEILFFSKFFRIKSLFKVKSPLYQCI